jgi:hypothetical protein
MRIIITEEQLRLIIESEDKMKLLTIPEDLLLKNTNAVLNNYKKKGFDGINVFGNLDLTNTNININVIERLLDNIVIIDGYLNLSKIPIESLGNLESVGGDLKLSYSKITSLGNLKSVGGGLSLYKSKIESLGNLKSVGGYLYLYNSKIENLGNLESVGGDLDLQHTPIGKRLKSEMSKDEIKNKFGVIGDLYI